MNAKILEYLTITIENIRHNDKFGRDNEDLVKRITELRRVINMNHMRILQSGLDLVKMDSLSSSCQ